MTDYLAHNTDTDVLEFVTLTPPEAFRPSEGGGQYDVYELGAAHAVTITGTGATPGVQSGTTYLFKKSTGELELILGTEEFAAVPAAGAGSYDVWRLGTPTAVTVASAVPPV